MKPGKRAARQTAPGIIAMEGVPGSVMDEADLFRGTARSRSEPCVCGGVIVALLGPDEDIEGAVRAHQASGQHVAWRRWQEWLDEQ